MGDLISRKAVINNIKDFYHGMLSEKLIRPFELINYLEEFKTAYDVEKVVEQLEKLKSIRSMKDYTSTGIVHDYVDIKEAIEIVKGGGVDVL